ncbi:hypothetical protein EDD36DRAFT_315486 [Exophiala viscosa]|uniref:Uncharacterized protein n=1 Tax=Exophiala viscosa TaxID=2486360 RepID=A0AAN6IBE7_9EURO|nr:hypothetical protein EDD36DRAFT_315486 [Exophiala viscosa]
MSRRKDYSTPLPFPYAKQFSGVPDEGTLPPKPQQSQQSQQPYQSQQPQQPQLRQNDAGFPIGRAAQGRDLLKEAEADYMKIAVGQSGGFQGYRHPPREDEGYASHVDEISTDGRSSSEPSMTEVISPLEEDYARRRIPSPPAIAQSRSPVQDTRQTLLSSMNARPDPPPPVQDVRQTQPKSINVRQELPPPVPDIKQILSMNLNRYPEIPPRKQRRQKGPIYEEVEGATLDARPASASNSKDPDEVIPEFEAADVREIPSKRPHLTWESSLEDDDPSDQSYPPSTASRQTPSPNTSRSAGSGSSNSTIGAINPRLHEAMGGQPSSSAHGSGAAELDGRPSNPRESFTPSDVSDVASELSGESAPIQTQTRQLTLDSIVEEDGESVNQTALSAAAPSPAVPRATDADIAPEPRGIHKISSTLKSALSGSGEEPRHDDRSASQGNDPPKVVSIDGIGGDQHVYEMIPETSNLPTPSNESGHSSISPMRVDTSTSSGGSSSASSANSGLFGHVKSGLASVTHAVHERVKKNVSFSPVDDVRFRTPSPGQSTIGAGSRRSSGEQRREY